MVAAMTIIMLVVMMVLAMALSSALGGLAGAEAGAVDLVFYETMTHPPFVNNAFRYMRMGYASALAWILTIIILLITMLILKSSPMWVHYEAEKK